MEAGRDVNVNERFAFGYNCGGRVERHHQLTNSARIKNLMRRLDCRNILEVHRIEVIQMNLSK